MLIKNKWMIPFLLLSFSGTAWASDGTGITTEMVYVVASVSNISDGLKKKSPCLSTGLHELNSEFDVSEHASWFLNSSLGIGSETACYMPVTKYISTCPALQWVQDSSGDKGSRAAQVAMLRMGIYLP